MKVSQSVHIPWQTVQSSHLLASMYVIEQGNQEFVPFLVHVNGQHRPADTLGSSGVGEETDSFIMRFKTLSVNTSMAFSISGQYLICIATLIRF
jgi:hypothetical protein